MKLFLLSSTFVFSFSNATAPPAVPVHSHDNNHASANSLRGSSRPRLNKKQLRSSPNSNGGSIHCIAPHDWRFQRESHQAVCDSFADTNVPYSCDGGDKLCCTSNHMTNIELGKFGMCNKIYYHDNDNEDKYEELLDSKYDIQDDIGEVNFLSSHIQCNGPFNQDHACPANKIAYTCAAGERMCCNWNHMGRMNRAQRQHLKEDVVLPSHGLCTRDDGSTPTRPNKKRPARSPQAKECCTVDIGMSCPADAPNNEGRMLDYEAFGEAFLDEDVCCPNDEAAMMDWSTIMACYPPDDIDYDDKFAMEW